MFDTSSTLPAVALKTKTKVARKRKVKVDPVEIPEPVAPPDKSLVRYSIAGVALMSGLSAILNGYANAQHSPQAWAGWGMGLAIPAIILILGKVAGILWRRGHQRLAYGTAASGVGLLALSVWHCATSIALITGSPLALAMPMAVAIDVGFICCELAILTEGN